MLGFRRLALAVCSTIALLGATACASRSGPRTDLPATPLGSEWASSENRDHPLVGKIYDVRQKRFVSEQELNGAVASARLLFLGEIHDNPDHHLLQARLVRVATATGRRPSIAFEMLDETQQPAIDAIPKGDSRNADAYRDAVRWDESGWPPFKLYRPVFEAALEAGLPVVGANLPRERIRDATRKGVEALPAGARQRIETQGPLSPAILAEMRSEMAESHCGELPDQMVDPLILGQRARDAQMADRLLATATADGAILITGYEHARRDRGVPSYLSPDETSKGALLTVGFREARPDGPAAEDYVGDGDPARLDFVVFTPGKKREDPCIKFREHMKKRREHPPAGAGDGGTKL